MNTLLFAPKKQDRSVAILPVYSRNRKIICNLSEKLSEVRCRECPGAPKKEKNHQSRYCANRSNARNLVVVPSTPLRNKRKARASPSKSGRVNLDEQFIAYTSDGLFYPYQKNIFII